MALTSSIEEPHPDFVCQSLRQSVTNQRMHSFYRPINLAFKWSLFAEIFDVHCEALHTLEAIQRYDWLTECREIRGTFKMGIPIPANILGFGGGSPNGTVMAQTASAGVWYVGTDGMRVRETKKIMKKSW